MRRLCLLFKNHFELIGWLTAMIVLFFLPEKTDQASLCIFSLVGFDHCPGCGMGHAIHYALRGRLAVSFDYHPLGIFAVIVIFNRIKQLITTVKLPYETKPDQHDPRY